LANRLEELKVCDYHLAVDEDSEKEILEWIEAQAEKCKPIAHTGLRHYCEAKYPRFISRGLVDFFILRHRDDLTKIKSIPQEDPRLKVPRVFLDETMRRLRDYV
jgi:hypothetical protein